MKVTIYTVFDDEVELHLLVELLMRPQKRHPNTRQDGLLSRPFMAAQDEGSNSVVEPCHVKEIGEE